MFPGDPWQITRDSSGAPTGLNPAVYADFDAALRLAEAPTTIPAPSPAAASVPEGLSTVVTFNDIAVQRPLRVEYPAGTINWQSNAWMVSGPWGQFKTNSLSFNGSSVSSGTISFKTPRRLASLQAYNGGATTATVTFSSAGQPTKQVQLGAGQVATIELGWTGTCTTVTLATTNKWNTNFDNLVVY